MKFYIEKYQIIKNKYIMMLQYFFYVCVSEYITYRNSPKTKQKNMQYI